MNTRRGGGIERRSEGAPLRTWLDQTAGRDPAPSASTPPAASSVPGAAGARPGEPGVCRRLSPPMATAAVVAGASLLLVLTALVIHPVLSSVGTGFGTSFGFVRFVTVDGFLIAGLTGLVVAAALAILAVARRRQPASASFTPARRRIGLLVVAVALAGGSVLFFAVFSQLGLGYGTAGELLFLGAGMIAILGVVAAAVVGVLAVLPRRSTRATSLRTRSFVVLVVAMVVPSLLLAGLGVYASIWAWESAAELRAEQSLYATQRLVEDLDSLRSVPGGLPPAARAELTRVIGQAYAADLTGGAWVSTMADVKSLRVLPRWAIRNLAQKGYAVGALGGGRPRPQGSMPDIVAWRVGPREVRYFTSEAVLAPPEYYSSSIPLHRAPLGELAVIAGMGVAIVVCLGLLGAWILSRGVVRPVRRLAEASGRLAEGEAGVTVVPEGPRELRELAVSFNDMNAKMAKAQETEQAFLLSVSHELKTPLTSVRGYAEGIGDGTVDPAEGAAVIGIESSRLERLVGDLLESGRMRKSAFTVRREEVDLAAVADDVARRYEATARDAGLTLLLGTEAGGSATADHDRVLQVVSNLVENAIRCTPAPGTVTITTGPGAITVADTGRGLTTDDLPRAFERFYLYSRYGTDRPVGTGLGLAIVKELAEAMGGAVSVSSAVGVGTAFTVTLPAGVGSAAGDPPRATAASTTAAEPRTTSATTATAGDGPAASGDGTA